MKFCVVLILYIFGVIYCDSNKIHVVDKKTHTIDQRNQSASKCNQTNIEYWSVSEIFSLAVENEKCRSEAMHIINRKYNYATVKVQYLNINYDFKKSILLINMDDLPKGFWKMFGNKIENLQIEDGSYLDYPNALEVAIYCSESLKNIEITKFDKFYYKYALFNNTQPYKKVENLTIDNEYIITNPKIDTTKIFPNLRNLQVGSFRDNCIFDGKFSHLEGFTADKMIGTNFSRFFAWNSNLKKLNVFESSMEYLKAAHDLLPQLEDLTFVVPPDFRNGQKFIFEKVKIATIRDEFLTFDQSKLTFKSLENLTIEMGTVESYHNEQLIQKVWIDFIRNHKHLNSIRTTLRAYFHANGLLELSKAASLIEANIFGGTNIEVQHIMTFVKNNENLQNFKLYFVRSFNSTDFVKFVQHLRDELSDKWQIIQLEEDYVQAGTLFIPYQSIQLFRLEFNRSNTICMFSVNIPIMLILNLLITKSFIV